MIYVDRNRIGTPKILESEAFHEAIREQLDNHSKYKNEQQGIEINYSMINEFRGDTRELFHDKCAYCESRITHEGYDLIQHFRPPTVALDDRGEPRAGYWWLAYEWSNLYLVCDQCSRYKSNRFPIDGKPLAEGSTDYDSERYILLDPCHQEDMANEHFFYNAEGEVQATSERAHRTIETLGLNRNDLVERRSVTWDKFNQIILKNTSQIEDTLYLDELEKELISPAQEFIAMFRQMLKDAMDSLTPSKKSIAHIGDELEELAEDEAEYDAEEESAAPDEYFEPEVKRKSSKKTRKKLIIKEEQPVYATARFIEEVEIKNFKGIKHIKFKLPPASGKKESWLMFIGENGVGKSSILQAIGLALAGETKANALNLNWSSLIRNARGISKSEVKIRFTDRSSDLNMQITSDGVTTTPKESGVLTLGYGSTRFLPKGAIIDEIHRTVPEIRSLFDHLTPLKNVEQWLADTKEVKANEFNWIAGSLHDLLLMKTGGKKKGNRGQLFRRSRGRITMNIDGEPLGLKDLCDGYKSVMAYAMDIMMSVHKHFPSIRDAEGVVLLDEIETHLHPTWKIRIVDLIRGVFPRINFIVTTHDPLCLRGMLKKEVHVLTKGADGVMMEQLDVPPGMPIEDLLLGAWFKMDTTLDMDTIRLIDEHRALRQSTTEDSKRKERIKELEKKIDDRMQYNRTETFARKIVNTFYDEALSPDDMEDTSEFKSKLAARLRERLKK